MALELRYHVHTVGEELTFAHQPVVVTAVGEEQGNLRGEWFVLPPEGDRLFSRHADYGAMLADSHELVQGVLGAMLDDAIEAMRDRFVGGHDGQGVGLATVNVYVEASPMAVLTRLALGSKRRAGLEGIARRTTCHALGSDLAKVLGLPRPDYGRIGEGS